MKSNLLFGALGSLPLRAMALAATRGRVRVLCYHRTHDAVTLRPQIEYVRRAFVPVTGDEFCAALQSRSPLPERAVWVTFDDGDPSVLAVAQPILDEFEVSATLFICPGLIVGQDLQWTDVAKAAVERGLCWREELGPEKLMTLPDSERRAHVADLETRLREDGWAPPGPVQADVEGLRTWLAAGHSIGNHTWDHPCLDRCEPQEQLRQIERAHEWVRDSLAVEPRVFAYPYSHWTQTAERTMSDLGYAAAVLLDERLASLDANPYRVSRLHALSDSSAARFRATVSGAHSLVFTSNGSTATAA